MAETEKKKGCVYNKWINSQTLKNALAGFKNQIKDSISTQRITPSEGKTMPCGTYPYLLSSGNMNLISTPIEGEETGKGKKDRFFNLH